MHTGNGALNQLSAAQWRKSSRSGPYSDNCVEVAMAARAVGVRDSKDPAGPVLVFSAERWRSFVRQTQSGHFDI